MREFEYYVLDVFTDKPFTGNPLAVFPEAGGISGREMQLIASELNLSETVFVLDSDRALRRLRIFTPSRELPLAGHPVVGTWNLLARLGITPAVEDGIVEIEQELSLGVLPVALRFDGGRISSVEMTQGEFKVLSEVTDETEFDALAKALGIATESIGNERTRKVQVVSTGIGSLAVPVADLATLRSCKIDSRGLNVFYSSRSAVGVYAFCFETMEPESLVHTRFFAPGDGIPEDPVTGSAAGSLSGYLVHNGVVTEREFTIEQGDIMGRPGRVRARVDGEPGDVSKVRVAGEAVVLMNGNVLLP